MQTTSVRAASAAGSYQLLGEGLDSCAAPSATQMANFWNGTPYYYWGIYIGGDERACSQPNLTASWISTVTSGTVNGVSMAWKLLPIWVGPQDPCQSGYGNYISTNTTTAYNQGVNEAVSAYDEWACTLGQSSDVPIVYDMGYNGDTITSTCLAAIKSFINGSTASSNRCLGEPGTTRWPPGTAITPPYRTSGLRSNRRRRVAPRARSGLCHSAPIR